MTPATLSFLTFSLIVLAILFGIVISMGGLLALGPFLILVGFGVVGTVMIAKRQGKTWRNFLDD